MANLLTTISPEFAPLTQTNYLAAQIRSAVALEHIWRAQASSDMEVYPSKVGIPEIITVRGYRAPNTATNNVSNPNDPNAGISFSGAGYEQFKIQVDRRDGGDYVDMFARQFPIADKFVETYITLAQGAASTQDFVARNALYGTYTGGQTFVTANATANTNTISVDDIRGFQPASGSNGAPAQGEVPTSQITVGGNTYTLASVTADPVSSSSFSTIDGDNGLRGSSGTLTFTGPLAAADATKGALVRALVAPLMFRPNGRKATGQIVANDLLTMAMVQQMRNSLRNNGMRNPTLHATPDALYGLYRDEEFQVLYRGAYGSATYTQGQVAQLLGVNIVEVTSAPIQETASGLVIHRPIMTTDGCLTEARMTDKMAESKVDGPVHTVVQDNIAMNTTAPTDPAGQFVKIAYLQWAGYACRPDRLLTPLVMPTASVANYKRAAVAEVTGVSGA